MDRRNKQRKNRGKFNNASTEKKSKDECVNDNSGNSEKKRDDQVHPVEASCSADDTVQDDTIKTAGNVTLLEEIRCPEGSGEDVASSKFSKRKVVSNWDRYEVDFGATDEGETGLQRGADFRELVDGAGGATSFFRFKDELEWEEQPAQTTAAEFLSLNCKDLASALLCVPLPTRLLIKEELFPKKILKKLEAAAKNQEKLYATEATLSHSVSQEVVNRTTQLLLDSCSDKIFSESLDDEPVYKADNEGATFTWATGDEASEDNEIQPSAGTKDLSAEPTDAALVQQKLPENNTQSSKIVSDSSTANIGLADEDDLEFLLSLSTNQAVLNSESETQKLGGNPKEPSVDLKAISKPPEVKLFQESSPQNLEDWLDSVLEE